MAVSMDPRTEAGEKGAEEPALLQETESRSSRSKEKELLHLLIEPCRRNAGNGGRELTDAFPGSRFYDEVKGCGKPNGTEHSHGVFRKSDTGVADGTNKALLEIAQSGAVVDNRRIRNPVSKGVYGEVTAESILLRCPEDVVHENHSVLVLHVAGRAVTVACLFRVRAVRRDRSPAEGGYFQDFILKKEMGQPEAATYETAVAKQPLDLVGPGVCGYVEVLGGSPQEQVADTSPYQVGDEAVCMESVERAQGIRAHLLSRYAVFLPGNDSRFHLFTIAHSVEKTKCLHRGRKLQTTKGLTRLRPMGAYNMR
jgi:hypothetical protein